LTPPCKRTVQRTNHRPAHKHECYSLIAVLKATILQNFSTPGALVVELLPKMWSGGFRKNCQLRRSVNRPGMLSNPVRVRWDLESPINISLTLLTSNSNNVCFFQSCHNSDSPSYFRTKSASKGSSKPAFSSCWQSTDILSEPVAQFREAFPLGYTPDALL
jgi:hypothetical protein